MRQGFIQCDVGRIDLQNLHVAQLRSAPPAAELARDGPRDVPTVAIFSLVA